MITIEDIIAKEASDNTPHDKIYAEELRGAYRCYKDMEHKELQYNQLLSRTRRRNDGGSHRSTADCMVIHFLLKDKENGQADKD